MKFPQMKVTRAAAWGLGGALMAGWLAAAAGTPTAVPPSAAQPDEPPPLTLPPAIQEEADKLRRFLDAPPRPHQAERNPFEFAHRPPRLEARVTAPEIVPVQPSVPPGPGLKLDGIAEDAVPGGTVRTAIISAAGQLFLVKEGGSVTSRYRVTRIGADAVELEDLMDGTALRIGLK